MEKRLDLDYCPSCDLPTFNHEEIVMIAGQFLHRFCFEGTKQVAKRSQLKSYPFKTN